MKKQTLFFTIGIVAGMLIVGVLAFAKKPEKKAPPITKAIAVITPTEGNEASGTVTFTKTANGIRVQAEIEGLAPGKHGFHIHELGDISASDGTAAGGHFAPFGNDHGAPDDENRHVGDLGNITADENGVGTYDRVDTVIRFHGPANILGRGIIIHAGEDDLTTQTTGAAGARVGQGVIGVDKPE